MGCGERPGTEANGWAFGHRHVGGMEPGLQVAGFGELGQ